MRIVKLIGIEGDYLYESWQTNLFMILQDLNIEYHLEEVHDIDSIIRLKTNAIPALMIDGRILLEQKGPALNTDELKHSILNYLSQAETV